jgi:CSLREA domain-containing protein
MRYLVLVVLLTSAIFATARPVSAAAITVTTTADELNTDGDCSLREAIRAANLDRAVDACPAGSGADTITLPAGTYTLRLLGGSENAARSGDLDLTSDLTLTGAGVTTTIIDGNAIDRVFDIAGTARVTITQLTIRNGTTAGGTSACSGGDFEEDSGGGILNCGALTLIETAVRGNVAGINGGGIFSSGSLLLLTSTVDGNSTNCRDCDHSDGGGLWNLGTATVRRSTISGNHSQQRGGGIDNFRDGTLAVIDSTISGNRARFVGGGIDNAGGIVEMNNTTISDNFAAEGLGGGVATFGALVVRNTILARNGERTGQAPDCWGELTSRGYNLLQRPRGCTLSGDLTGNVLRVAPKLGPLQHNGGPTKTQALLAGSPAIDAGNPAAPGSGDAACAVVDQRGVARPKDGDGDGVARCDIGAVERKSATTP